MILIIVLVYFIIAGNNCVLSQDVVTVEAVVGQSAELPCNVTSEKEDDKLNILAWYKNGSSTAFYSRDLRGGSGNVMSPSKRYRLLASEEDDVDNLEILNIRPSDADLYHCNVDFAASPARKTFVRLIVIEPPQKLWVIHENGTRVATATAGSNTSRNIGPYYVGDTLHLCCVAFGGKPQPTLEWWSEQRMLNNETTPLSEQRIRGDLSFGPLVREHHGQVFTCVTSNNENTSPLTIDISIDMYLPPELVSIRVAGETGESVFSGRVHCNDMLTLQCRVFGARPLPTVIWRLDDSHLMSLHQNITMEPSQQLMISEVQLSISHEYDESRITCCVPSYRRGRDSEEFVCTAAQYLTVLYAPILNIEAEGGIENETLTIVKGCDVSLNCTFQANPNIYQLIWFHEDDILEQKTEEKVSLHPILELRSVSENDSGEYVCAATNDEGSSYSEPVFLDVVFPPYCEDEIIIEYGVTAEDYVNLTCKVRARPAPYGYRWLIISELEGGVLHANRSQTVETLEPTLLYQRPNDTTALVYCWGLNSVKSKTLPQTRCQFMVTDETAPQAPSSCVAVRTVMKDITVTCTPGHDGGLPQKFKFTAHSLDSDEQIVSITSQEPTFMIQEPKQENYKFVIVAFNDKGESKSLELEKKYIVEERKDPEHTISAVTNITTLALALCGGVALLALAACGLVLCAHERAERHDLPHDKREPPLCAYNTDESNCETYNDSEDGSEYNMRRSETFRKAVVKSPPKNYDVNRTSSFHSARYMQDVEPDTRAEPRRTSCRVHSLQNISRKRETDVFSDNLVMHLPPETNYKLPPPMNTFYTMPRKVKNKSQRDISDETSEITQASDGFSLPPPPDEYGSYRAASRIKDIPIKSTPTYTTIIKPNAGTVNRYGRVVSPINTVGIPSANYPGLYSYQDDGHQVKTNPFDDET
ncbi:neural cell adhesion molecule 2-like isoform X2 [Leptidea sinapis]|uniref:neural cell adhesion molecule 2-like isoform X2 n=1 Tax=Leptidea sinapis TaxID=189913 RepID=UPI0021C47D8C|nr:neural cell adhesion molecule 2-like isoform X2 [Leptidea sinapis]